MASEPAQDALVARGGGRGLKARTDFCVGVWVCGLRVSPLPLVPTRPSGQPACVLRMPEGRKGAKRERRETVPAMRRRGESAPAQQVVPN